jgi:hypothetical protein
MSVPRPNTGEAGQSPARTLEIAAWSRSKHDATEAWLDRVVSLLRLPAPEREAIRAELREHLRDRVRDLMLAGASETHATSQAISELGDAAALARRYQEAIEPSSRRSIMQIGIASAAAAAVVISGAALLQSGGAGSSGAGSSGGGAGAAGSSGGGGAAIAPASAEGGAGFGTGSEHAAALAAELAETRARLEATRERLMACEVNLVRAQALAESMAGRVSSAEKRASEAESGMSEARRQMQMAREETRAAQVEVERARAGQAQAEARVRVLEAQRPSMVTTPRAPAAYVPPTDAAKTVLAGVMVDMRDAPTLAHVVEQASARNAKVRLRNLAVGAHATGMSEGGDLPDRELSVLEVLGVINARIKEERERLVARTGADGGVEIDTQGNFDQAERSLVVYDVRDLVERSVALIRSESPMVPQQIATDTAVGRIHETIVRSVSPDLWLREGSGTISVLPGSLVIGAPERSHHQIRWLLEQLRATDANAGANAGADAGAGGADAGAGAGGGVGGEVGGGASARSR